MNSLYEAIKEVEQLKQDLQAMRNTGRTYEVGEGSSMSDAAYGKMSDTPIEYEVTEPDFRTREKAEKQLKEVYETTPWISVKYLAGTVSTDELRIWLKNIKTKSVSSKIAEELVRDVEKLEEILESNLDRFRIGPSKHGWYYGLGGTICESQLKLVRSWLNK